MESSKRERKAPKQYVPAEVAAVPTKFLLIEKGAGIALGTYPLFSKGLDKLKDPLDTLKALHQFLYMVPGKKHLWKSNVRKFSGFPERFTKADKISKLTEKNALWNVSRLKNVLEICGVDKMGTRDQLIERLVDFMFCPTILKTPEKPKPKQKTNAKKRTATKKPDHALKKRRRTVSAYVLYVKGMSAEVKAANPEATFAELSRLIAAQWAALEPEHKEIWNAQAAQARAVMAAEDTEGSDEGTDDDNNDGDEDGAESDDFKQSDDEKEDPPVATTTTTTTRGATGRDEDGAESDDFGF